LKQNQKFENVDELTVTGFGDEWTRFDQSELSDEQQQQIFQDYFDIFPWDMLGNDACGIDVGCGSGRWAEVVASRVGHLHLVDASDEALQVARNKLKDRDNISYHHASVNDMPIDDESLDFAYSLGVLHHLPDTQRAIKSISDVLKPGKPFLLYLYYAFDNRPLWYRALWKVSDNLRSLVSRMPMRLRYIVSQTLAMTIYWPLARIGLLLEKVHMLPGSWPLSYYRDKSFYVMRTDALDRFGTRLEQRYTQEQIGNMLENAGFGNICFSDKPPYWCAVGVKKSSRDD